MSVTRQAAGEAVQKLEEKREFIGKGWVNTSESGKKYIQIKLDQDITEATLNQGMRIQMFENKKREGVNPNTGKEYKDADYRLSFVEPVK